MMYLKNNRFLFLLIGVSILFFGGSSRFLFPGSVELDVRLPFQVSPVFDSSYEVPNWQHPYGYLSLVNSDNTSNAKRASATLTLFFCPGDCKSSGLQLHCLWIRSDIDYYSSSSFFMQLDGQDHTVTNQWSYQGSMESFLVSLNFVQRIPVNYFNNGLIQITLAIGPTLAIHNFDLAGAIEESYAGSVSGCQIASKDTKFDLAWNLHGDFGLRLINVLSGIYLVGSVTKYFHTNITGDWARGNASPTGKYLRENIPTYSWNAEIKDWVWSVGIRFCL